MSSNRKKTRLNRCVLPRPQFQVHWLWQEGRDPMGPGDWLDQMMSPSPWQACSFQKWNATLYATNTAQDLQLRKALPEDLVATTCSTNHKATPPCLPSPLCPPSKQRQRAAVASAMLLTLSLLLCGSQQGLLSEPPLPE